MAHYPSKAMLRLFDSLRNTRWVIWSSPVLLLVLVFTLSAGPAQSAKTSSRRALPTTTLPTTPRPSVQHRDLTQTTPRATTTLRTTRSPSASVAKHSSPSTASSATNFVSASEVNASSSAYAGALSPAEPFVLTLVGPGSWTLASSTPLVASLTCATQRVIVQVLVVVAAKTTCQLSLRATEPSSWQLTAQR